MRQQTAQADGPTAHCSPVWQQARQTSGARVCCGRPGRAKGKCKIDSTQRQIQSQQERFHKNASHVLTSRRNLSTSSHLCPATSAGGTGSASLRHASCTTQTEGLWSRSSVVSSGLCRVQATRWQATATEMFPLPCCEIRSETQRTKRPGKPNKKNQRNINRNKIEATAGTTKRKFSSRKNPKLHLTRFSSRKLLFPSTAAAIDFAPSSPIWLPLCTAHVSAHASR